MTPKKVLEVLEFYETVITMEAQLEDPDGHLKHLLDMIPKMKELIKEGMMDKTFRWLGFMQGVLWAESVYTLEELNNHNRPESRPPYLEVG